jgi:hypothetical protein
MSQCVGPRGIRSDDIENIWRPLQSRWYLVPNPSYNHFRFAIRYVCYSDVIKGVESLPGAVPNIPHEMSWKFKRKHAVIATRMHCSLYFRNIVRHIELPVADDVMHGCREYHCVGRPQKHMVAVGITFLAHMRAKIEEVHRIRLRSTRVREKPSALQD